ncbi:hypothetical protein [Streptomyces caatingaensis]|uniref:Aromatic ring-opening dioxygenase LigA n=1 Tax=Streptomyces caatingaensis TaxID=1678637 RepID=A0A0K9XDG1_9ACTN|nr:hypothetical protein [Streptomyces caatingaensis]KNB51469.1 hypothetical protein AC230_13835 [Streptomyces caatingaensis]
MSTPPTDTPATGRRPRPRQRLLLAIGIPVITLAVAAGSFFAFGGSESREDGRSLADACQGALSKSDLAALLGSDRLHAGQRTDAARGAGWVDRCVVQARGGASGVVELNIGWADEAQGALSRLGRSGSSQDAVNAVPIGHGWSGTVVAGGPTADAAVLLPCRGIAKSLLVSASAASLGKDAPFRDPKTVGTLARLVTGTAERAAGKLECEAVPGTSLQTLAPPPLGGDDAVPLDRAQGTCRALRGTGSGSGRAVLETAADDGPIEDCFITDGHGKRLYHLGAYYGPYARDLGADPPGEQKLTSPSGTDGKTGDSWATAGCRAFFGKARFTLTSARGENASDQDERRAQREMLTAFARDAVKRHGCTDLALPRVNPAP